MAVDNITGNVWYKQILYLQNGILPNWRFSSSLEYLCPKLYVQCDSENNETIQIRCDIERNLQKHVSNNPEGVQASPAS